MNRYSHLLLSAIVSILLFHIIKSKLLVFSQAVDDALSAEMLELRNSGNQFSDWQNFMTPVAETFDFPVGAESGSYTYNAQPFMMMNEARGAPHLGDDFNGIGGQNTDLGDFVFAAADGLVVYTGIPSEGWGNVIIMNHKLLDGNMIQTMYAHLYRINVKLDQLVGRGEKIGLIGNADGLYAAHLHYEMRVGDGVDIGGGYSANPLNRIDPTKFTQEHYGSITDLDPSILEVILDAKN
jgi:Peptidase family M23